MLIWRSRFDSRPGKISPFFIAFTSTLHNTQPTMQCVPINFSPVKKHQEKNVRSSLELRALSDTQRALPRVLHSMALRQSRQLFTDFVKSSKLIFARFKAVTAILIKIQVSWAFARKRQQFWCSHFLVSSSTSYLHLPTASQTTLARPPSLHRYLLYPLIFPVHTSDHCSVPSTFPSVPPLTPRTV